jgi:biopolymer transport protein ExbB
MLKTCGPIVFGVLGNRFTRSRFKWLLTAVLGLEAWLSGGGYTIGREQESPRASQPVKQDRSDANSDDDDTEQNKFRRPTTTETSESGVTAISNASTPVAVVTAVISVMSFYLIALVVWMALHYRTQAAVPHELVREVQELLDQANYNEAYQRLIADSSFLARVLVSGVRRLPAGVAHARRAMEIANEDITMEMEHRTTYLATVGTLGPMIGLVGTVYGMIIAFRVIALERSTPQASQLAAGISTALYSTLEGIAISIPAIFFYAIYRNRIARLSLEVGIVAEPVLDRFAPGVRVTRTSETDDSGSTPSSRAYRHPFAVSIALKASSGPRSASSSTESAQS